MQRKERERVARRREILAAARKVFAAKGYERATLDEIAEQAEFAKGTLYNYFDSKETLFREIVREILNEMKIIAEEAIAGGGTVREQFSRYAKCMFEFYRASEEVFRILIYEIHRVQVKEDITAIMKQVRAIASLLGSVLKREMNKKSIVKEDPVELAFVFVGMIHNRAMRRLFSKPGLASMDTEAEAAFLASLFFNGAARR